MNKTFPNRYKDKFVFQSTIVYDDIVDRTDFKIGQDSARNQRIGDTGGSLGDGLYDFGGDKKPQIDSISNAELTLRSGALDKADVDTLSRVMKKAAQMEVDENVKQKLAKEKQDLNDARQSFIDKQTGFNQEVDNK